MGRDLKQHENPIANKIKKWKTSRTAFSRRVVVFGRERGSAALDSIAETERDHGLKSAVFCHVRLEQPPRREEASGRIGRAQASDYFLLADFTSFFFSSFFGFLFFLSFFWLLLPLPMAILPQQLTNFAMKLKRTTGVANAPPRLLERQ